MIKTYEEALNKVFLDEKLNDYNLEKIHKALMLLKNPLDWIKIIHIAWTNWKWSVAKMTYAVLKEAWFNVWVFTSPHLIDIKERFETIAWYITKHEFLDILNKILSLWIEFSYFEKCTLIAFEFFKLRKVEYAVIEVWLGWRLDSTNVVNPIITCITSISYDHQHILWDTLEKISYEKAWIIKPWIPVVVNHRNKVIEDIAKERWAKVIFTEKHIKTNMLGDYQERNAWLVYEIWRYIWIDEMTILKWLQNVKHNWRLQYLSKNLLVDWAHNEWCLKELKIYLNTIKSKFEKINYCFSLKKWKDISLVTDILWKDNSYFLIDKPSINLEDTNELQKQFKKIWKEVQVLGKQEIIELAKSNNDELYIVFWSLYMIWEFLEFK